MAATLCIVVFILAVLARQPKAAGDDAVSPASQAEAEVHQLRAEQDRLASRAGELEARLEALKRGEEVPMDDNTLQQRVNLATMETEQGLKARVTQVMQTAAPVVARAAKIKRCIEDGVSQAKAKAEAKAREELAMAAERLVEVLDDGQGGAPVSMIRWMRGINHTAEKSGTDDESQAALPLPLIIAGLAAPLQLQILATWNRVQLFLVVAVLVALAGTMAFDFGRPCGTGTVWTWAAGMVVIFTSTIAARLAVISSAAAALREIHRESESHTPSTAGDGIMAAHRRIVQSSDSFFKALLAQDRVINSTASSLLNLLNVAHVLWGACGVYLSFQHVVQDSLDCRAQALRLMMHIYVFMYVVLLSFTIPMALTWIFNHALAYRSLSFAILSKVKQLDDQMSIGVPFFTLLCQAFLLRRITYVGESELQNAQVRVDDLRSRKEKSEKRADEVNSELEAKWEHFREVSEKVNMMQSQMMDEASSHDKGGGSAGGGAGDSKAFDLEQAKELARMTLARAKESGVDLELLLQRAREAAEAAGAKAAEAASAGPPQPSTEASLDSAKPSAA
jgi:uncharacterized protein YlxW (UPF0749 family)